MAIKPAEQSEALGTEFEMKARVRQIRMRDLALFVVVAGVVAVVVVLVGREAGLGEEAGARIERMAPEAETAGQSVAAAQDDAEPEAAAEQSGEEEGEAEEQEPAGEQEEQAQEHALTITLEAPEICETMRALGYASYRAVRDDDGVTQRNSDGTAKHESVSSWARVAEVEVSWSVSGGAAPYTLMIDGETRDASGDYRGAKGTAWVSCALAFNDSFIHESNRGTLSRRYAEEPTVDSGLKTVEVTARDADGNIGSASVNVYVVRGGLDSGDVLKRGETYRILGHLVTIPKTHDMIVGGEAQPDCANVPADQRCEAEQTFEVVGLPVAIALFQSDLAEARRWDRRDAAAVRADPGVGEALDAFADSVGSYPTVDRAEQ